MNKPKAGQAFFGYWKLHEEREVHEGHAQFGGVSTAQSEELYAYFKEIETQEQMTGKSLSAASTQWVLDSGTSNYMTVNIHLIRNAVKLPKPVFITTTNDVTVMVEKVGIVVVTPEIVLNNVLYSPEFSCNLTSIWQ